jgi:hypothetical protein
MTEQTEAQRLADELVALHGYPLSIKAAAELRRLDEKCEALIGDAVRETRQIHRIAVLEAANEQLLKVLETDRQLLQQALDALMEHEGNYKLGNEGVERHIKATDALQERLAHCDRCGKRLGGEGDIHTCTPPAAPMTEFEEAVAAVDNTLHHAIDHWQNRALKAEALLAQPEQEPVAWPCVIAEADFEQNTVTLEMQCSDYKVGAGQHWLHTTPPAAQRKPLTDGEIQAIHDTYYRRMGPQEFARAIEAAHGITGEHT